ncbi:uncharacterized protein [Euwallacea fornicatus]|uniref:uncharacterized protein n=1 Tax=Euwallacea fornicatus TaxID=995702 RepID=UPI00338D4AD6
MDSGHSIVELLLFVNTCALELQLLKKGPVTSKIANGKGCRVVSRFKGGCTLVTTSKFAVAAIILVDMTACHGLQIVSMETKKLTNGMLWIRRFYGRYLPSKVSRSLENRASRSSSR